MALPVPYRSRTVIDDVATAHGWTSRVLPADPYNADSLEVVRYTCPTSCHEVLITWINDGYSAATVYTGQRPRSLTSTAWTPVIGVCALVTARKFIDQN